MANKFKAGDKVRYVRGGKIGWEADGYASRKTDGIKKQARCRH